MYIINNYHLIEVASKLYVSNYGKGAKISNQALSTILKTLQQQELKEENEALKALLRLHLTQGEKKKDAMSEFEEFKPLREIQKERCGLANFDIDDESSLASSSDEEQDCLHPM